MRRKTLALLSITLIILIAVSYLVLAPPGGITRSTTGNDCTLSLVQRISLPPAPGRIDHMDVDLVHGRMYVAMLGNDSLAVIDLNQATFVRSVTGLRTPQGVLFIPSASRLLITNAGDGTVDILDSANLGIVKVAQLSSDADNIRYDVASGLAYVGYGNGGIATLNATTGQVVATIGLVGHPESFQLDTNDSRMFVNLPQAHYIAVIDRNNGSITARWPLPANASQNFPMAIDETHHRLFVGARQPAEVLVYDAVSGRLVTKISVGQGPDDIFYSASGCLFVSSRDGFVYGVSQIDPDHYSLQPSIPTGMGAGTSLFVPRSNRLYVAIPQSTGESPQVYVYQH